MSLLIRAATAADAEILCELISGIAEYENLTDQMKATPALLREWLFEKRAAEALIAEADGEAVGYALFFCSFSTFEGRAGLYLEDLYICPDARGKGYGSALFDHLRELAGQRGYARFEWSCLDWNQPSIEFYRRKGATPLSEWTMWRVTIDS